MTYREQLESPYWLSKRTEIVNRDNHKCRACNNTKLVNELRCGFVGLEPPFANPNSLKRIGYLLPDFRAQLFLYRDHELGNATEDPIVYFIDGHPFPSIKLVRVMTVRELYHYKSRERLLYEAALESLNAEYDRFFQTRNTTYVSDYDKKKIEDAALNSKEHKERVHYIQNEYSPQAVALTDADFAELTWTFAKGLNVHHTYYQTGLRPWEYPNGSLQTYCHICHLDLHSKTQIPKLDSNGNEIGLMTPCPRCGGAGELEEYSHVQNGICFQCNGAQYLELI